LKFIINSHYVSPWIHTDQHGYLYFSNSQFIHQAASVSQFQIRLSGELLPPLEAGVLW